MKAIALARFAPLIGAFLAQSDAAQALNLGCVMTLRLHNASGEQVGAQIPTFQVRSRTVGVAGPWRRVQNRGWQPDAVEQRINAGQHISDGYESALLCQDRRQFRLDYTCRSGRRRGQTFDVQFPASGWSRVQNVTIDIGHRCD